MTIGDMLSYAMIPIFGIPIFGPITAIFYALTEGLSHGSKTLIVIGKISRAILICCVASFWITIFILLACGPFIVRNVGLKILFFLFQLAFLAEFIPLVLIKTKIDPWAFSKKTNSRLTWLIVQPLKLIIGPNVVKKFNA